MKKLLNGYQVIMAESKPCFYGLWKVRMATAAILTPTVQLLIK